MWPQGRAFCAQDAFFLCEEQTHHNAYCTMLFVEWFHFPRVVSSNPRPYSPASEALWGVGRMGGGMPRARTCPRWHPPTPCTGGVQRCAGHCSVVCLSRTVGGTSVPVYVLTFIFNAIWYQTIADHAFSLMHRGHGRRGGGATNGAAGHDPPASESSGSR